ncbi:thermonuclease family protein [Methylorubrum zatmanii]|nr:thermonuclease family protein [Methylorubrum zatmanii]MBD8906380.1 nuclease [Methylorubrum zatmanii]
MRRTGFIGVVVLAASAAGLCSSLASESRVGESQGGEFRADASRAGESVTGRARVLSGDTLLVGGRVIGLYGVAAPGLKQSCLNAQGQSYACGAHSAKALAAHLKETPVTCQIRETDAYGRAISVCLRDKEDVSAWLAEKGLAMAERGGKAAYVGAETVAWGKRLGLWAGSFEDPTSRPRTSYVRANALADAQPEAR